MIPEHMQYLIYSLQHVCEIDTITPVLQMNKVKLNDVK